MERIAEGTLALIPAILQLGRKFTGYRRKIRMPRCGPCRYVLHIFHTVIGPERAPRHTHGSVRSQF